MSASAKRRRRMVPLLFLATAPDALTIVSRAGTDVYVERSAERPVTAARAPAQARAVVSFWCRKCGTRSGWWSATAGGTPGPKGSHRIYKHPTKPGIVVIAGHPADDVHRGIWLAILRQAGLRED